MMNIKNKIKCLKDFPCFTFISHLSFTSAHTNLNFSTKMHIFALVDSLQNSIGRMNVDDLPDQACMELLVGEFRPVSMGLFQDEVGDFIEVCDWQGVHCDSKGTITRVNMVLPPIDERLALAYIPRSVKSFDLRDPRWGGDMTGQYSGSLDTQSLPHSLELFSITHHAFSGEVDLAKLPSVLSDFDISRNKFHGSCNLTSLPQGLKKCNLSENKFDGSISLEKLPNSLECLKLSWNNFSGSFSLLHPPARLTELYAMENSFRGNAVVASSLKWGDARISLMGNPAVTGIVDESGKRSKSFAVEWDDKRTHSASRENKENDTDYPEWL